MPALSPSRYHRMGSPFVCKWITLTDGTRQLWCGTHLVWSSSWGGPPPPILRGLATNPALSPSRAGRQVASIYPVIVNGQTKIRWRPLAKLRTKVRRELQRNPPINLGGMAQPAVALRPGVMVGQPQVNFPVAAAQPAAPAPAQAVIGQPMWPWMPYQNFWPQPPLLPQDTGLSIEIETSPYGARAVVIDAEGTRLWMSPWRRYPQQARVEAQRWIRANF